MKLKGDQSTTRALNRRLVLNALRSEGERSRVEIAGMTGLSQAAVSAVVGELLEEGFVKEGEGGKSSGGRKPIPLRIDYASRLSVGLKLTKDRLEAVLTDLSTAPIASYQVPLFAMTPSIVADAAGDAVAHLIPDPNDRRAKLIGVGLAMPGIIDADEGVCRVSQRLGWENVPIAELLAKRIQVPVWVDNDVNAFAIAQTLFGHGRHRRSVLVLIIGTGVGAALVFDGKIHRGARYSAGEIAFPETGRDHFEERARWHEHLTEPAMSAEWREVAASLPIECPRDLEAAALEAHSEALSFLKERGKEIGQRLVSMIDLIDPEVVVLGGEAVKFGRHLFDPLVETVRALCFGAPPPLEIDWENNVWSIGASALATQHFFDFERSEGLTFAQ
jgi:predicted NBD/HSP70 family sugar kinase